jgi:CRISPR-associated protein Cst1
MLKWTGHPLVDIGVATVTCFAEKERPEDVTLEDLDGVADYITEQYVHGGLTPYLSSVFTMNAVYTQPSWKKDVREQEARKLLRCYKEEPTSDVAGLRCAFSGEPATRLVYRQHVPMLTGEGVLNFFPAGLGGLPISGRYLLALQALPLGSRRCVGRLFAAHSPEDPDLTLRFARKFLQDNRRLMLLAEQSEEKYFDAKVPRTLLVNNLLELERERRDSDGRSLTPSVTAYFLTNDGRDPRIDLLHLPAVTVSFLRKALSDKTRHVWKGIELAAWQREITPKQASKKRTGQETISPAEDSVRASQEPNPEVSRNYLFEDLFDLPRSSPRFIRTYFLRRGYRAGRADDPRQDYSLQRDLDLISWELTRLFLKEILSMDSKRINAIRDLGDRIAAYIENENDRRFFQRFYMIKKYPELRNLLIKASSVLVKRGSPPLVGMDEFIDAFEDPDAPSFDNWALVRDLLLIRTIEQLHHRGWFKERLDVLETLEQEEEQALATVG